MNCDGRIRGWLFSLAFSLVIHALIIATAFLTIPREKSQESPPLGMKVTLSKKTPSTEDYASPKIQSQEPEFSQSPTKNPLPPTPARPTAPVETAPAKPPKKTVPIWQIDVPPTLVQPGDMDNIPDINSMLDALPLIATIYLTETGRPYLVLYDPSPPNPAGKNLNAFFSSAVFSPAMAGGRPVPSILRIPLSIRRPQ